MAIPTDHMMLWTEIYQGYCPKPGKIINSGWCCLPKDTPVLKAVRRIEKHFHTHDYAGKIVCVTAYPEDCCAFKFKPTDKILAIFG